MEKAITRLDEATVFDKDNSGRITAKEMHSVMSQFELTDSELEEMIKEGNRSFPPPKKQGKFGT